MSTPAPALTEKEIPELTDAYRKAHKNYVLASGLLASWELIGITIQTKERWGIELKSPAAVPLILFTLVIYFSYKTTIEWVQCNLDRKKHPAAKWDYRVAHGIAFTAIAISFVQYLLRIQIVDVLSRHGLLVALGMSAVGGPLITAALISIIRVAGPRHSGAVPLITIIVGACALVLITVAVSAKDHSLLAAGCYLLGLAAIVYLYILMRWAYLKKRS